MKTKNNLYLLLAALLVICNLGIIARLVMDLIGCMDNDDLSPKKIIIHYFKIGVSINGISGFVYLVTQYFK